MYICMNGGGLMLYYTLHTQLRWPFDLAGGGLSSSRVAYATSTCGMTHTRVTCAYDATSATCAYTCYALGICIWV